MDAKDYLSQYLSFRDIANRCHREIKTRRMMIDQINKINLPDDSKTKNNLKLAYKNIEKIHDAECIYIEKSNRVENFIKSIPGIEGDLLRLRYIEGKIWPEIAEEISYSLTGVFVVNKRATKIVEEMLSVSESMQGSI